MFQSLKKKGSVEYSGSAEYSMRLNPENGNQ